MNECISIAVSSLSYWFTVSRKRAIKTTTVVCEEKMRLFIIFKKCHEVVLVVINFHENPFDCANIFWRKGCKTSLDFFL